MSQSAFYRDDANVLTSEQTSVDILDYTFDWADFLPQDDVIVESTWNTTGGTASAMERDGYLCSALIAGPVGIIAVSNTIRSAFGRRKRLDFNVIVTP